MSIFAKKAPKIPTKRTGVSKRFKEDFRGSVLLSSSQDHLTTLLPQSKHIYETLLNSIPVMSDTQRIRIANCIAALKGYGASVTLERS